MAQQKTKIVFVGVGNLGHSTEKQSGVEEVNTLLSEGWQLQKHLELTPVSGGAGHSHALGCLLLLYKSE